MTTILSQYRLTAGKNDVMTSTYMWGKDIIKALNGKAGLKAIKSMPVAKRVGNSGVLETYFLVPGPGYTNAAKDGHAEFVSKDQDIQADIADKVIEELSKFLGVRISKNPSYETARFGSYGWYLGDAPFKTPDKSAEWFVMSYYKKPKHSYDADGTVEIYLGEPTPEFKARKDDKSGFKPTKNWLYLMIRITE